MEGKLIDQAEVYTDEGDTLLKSKRYRDALASYEQALAITPDSAKLHLKRGFVLLEMRQFYDALLGFDKAIALKPDYAEAYNFRGRSLNELSRFDEALASCRTAVELRPGYAEAYKNLGNILVNKGDIVGAEKMFVQSLALKPDFAAVISNLTVIRKYRTADHDDVGTIQRLLNKPGISDRDREHLYFALGKIYDDCGLYDDAFECYRQGNQIRNVDVTYDANGVTELTSNSIEVFSKEFLAQPFAFGSDSRTPIFIVGMPRSGTTLMASMLSNHASVDTAGEVVAISEFALLLPKLIAGHTPYPQVARHITPAMASLLIKGYEDFLRRDVGLSLPRVIDKNTFNFKYLGLISMLFPKSHIIHCMRNPWDTIISNYFQHFSYIEYSFDLSNIGHFYGQYARLMEHWRTALPMKMIEIRYEDLIMNTEKVMHATLDALGLDWDERCISPHTNRCAVNTASNWQVRQPIYQHSVERWRHYEKHLAPLIETFRLTEPTTA